MNVNDIKKSKFLKKEDVGQGVLVTVSAVTMENIAKDGADAEMRAALHFNETEKPLILNSTNAQIMARITGAGDEIEKAWVGAQVVLYDDPNVSYQGKLTGGIRIRAPRNGGAGNPAPAKTTLPPANDLPF